MASAAALWFSSLWSYTTCVHGCLVVSCKPKCCFHNVSPILLWFWHEINQTKNHLGIKFSQRYLGQSKHCGHTLWSLTVPLSDLGGWRKSTLYTCVTWDGISATSSSALSKFRWGLKVLRDPCFSLFVINAVFFKKKDNFNVFFVLSLSNISKHFNCFNNISALALHFLQHTGWNSKKETFSFIWFFSWLYSARKIRDIITCNSCLLLNLMLTTETPMSEGHPLPQRRPCSESNKTTLTISSHLSISVCTALC